MEYNAGYNIDIEGYHYDTGCIDFPKDRWMDTYNKRKKNKVFVAYILDIEKNIFVGTVNYQYNKEKLRYECGIIIESKHRNRGYAKKALQELFKILKNNEIQDIYDSFEKDRKETYKLFISLGFEVVEENIINKFRKDIKNIVVRKKIEIKNSEII